MRARRGHQLTAEPLRIDCVVIRKAKNVGIEKNIAAIFREWNMLEYKSPGDYVSVADFYDADNRQPEIIGGRKPVAEKS